MHAEIATAGNRTYALVSLNWNLYRCVITRDVEAEAEAGSGSGKFLWKRKLEAVNGYRFRFHLRCSTILALNVFLTQNKQLKHTITRVCEASCCRKYPLLNSQKFESTAVC